MSRASRDRDEVLLHWVRLRAAGHSPASISRRFYPRFSGASIRVATIDVMKDDLAQSGEPECQVASHYWTPGQRVIQ